MKRTLAAKLLQAHYKKWYGETTTTYRAMDEHGRHYAITVLKDAPPEAHRYAEEKLLKRRLDDHNKHGKA